MRQLVSAFALALLTTIGLSAQTATGTAKLAWNEATISNTNTPADVATVQAYTYKYYADGATTGTTLTPVTCTADATPATTITCQAPFPAFTPGTHTLQITASDAAGEGTKSAVFTFTFVVVPGAPTNIRIQ